MALWHGILSWKCWMLRLQWCGATAVVQWCWRHFWSTGIQVWSPTLCSGLRIQHCHSCSVGCNSGLDQIPGPGAPYAVGQPKRKKEKKKKNYCDKNPKQPLQQANVLVHTSRWLQSFQALHSGRAASTERDWLSCGSLLSLKTLFPKAPITFLT